MLLLSAGAGLAISIALIAIYGFADIGLAIAGAGWGMVAVVAFHFLQMVFSAEAWRKVLPPSSAAALPLMMGLRWIRESVNALLPVAQIGGEFVGARLLASHGVPLSAAGAGVTVDLSMEMVSQIIFTLFGIGLVMIRPHEAEITQWILGATLAAAAVVIAFVLTQRFGLFRLIERGLIRFAHLTGWSIWGEVQGLHEAIVAIYREPRRLGLACGHHLISWLLGGIEVMLALHFLGVDVDLRECLIIESLGQAFRAVGFAIPGSLGVQEGGYILVCGLLGLGPQAAIELSLVKRIREVVLGVPGLIAWQIIEGRRLLGHVVPGGAKRSSSELTS
ncbi:MAG TPA: lysylphosphatidylglycerol synthase domain-containing protein [Stellaceae bacterium]|nr:lysylphosphatidylglycerol synthase domain-containing protein [Stellaceae bacterium]